MRWQISEGERSKSGQTLLPLGVQTFERRSGLQECPEECRGKQGHRIAPQRPWCEPVGGQTRCASRSPVLLVPFRCNLTVHWTDIETLGGRGRADQSADFWWVCSAVRGTMYCDQACQPVAGFQQHNDAASVQTVA